MFWSISTNRRGDRSLRLWAEMRNEVSLEAVGIEAHGAGGDLLVGRSLEAEFACSHAAVVERDRRAEDAAGYGTPRVEIACAGVGIEDGAGLVFGCTGVRGRTGEDAGGAVWVGCGEIAQAAMEALGVEFGDWELAHAAGGAAWAAGHPVSAAVCGSGEGCVEDSQQFGISGFEIAHLRSISHVPPSGAKAPRELKLTPQQLKRTTDNLQLATDNWQLAAYT